MGRFPQVQVFQTHRITIRATKRPPSAKSLTQSGTTHPPHSDLPPPHSPEQIMLITEHKGTEDFANQEPHEDESE